jgi:hypothetical protein
MPKIPPGATRPEDHKKSAAQVEAEGGEKITVSWRDFEFVIDADADDWSARTTLAFEQGRAVTGVQGILGPKQFGELMKSNPKNKDVGELFQLIAKTIGLEPGE